MKKSKTIGELTQTRATWHISPVSKVKQSGKIYNRRKHKREVYA